jgi:plasmid stabilization system protein ParE
MFILKLLEDADREFQEAAQYYELRSEGLGERFIDIVTRKLETIQKYPERYPKRKSTFREVPIKTFPFIIVYTFFKKEKTITINSIFHTSRNPQKKYRKG